MRALKILLENYKKILRRFMVDLITIFKERKSITFPKAFFINIILIKINSNFHQYTIHIKIPSSIFSNYKSQIIYVHNARNEKKLSEMKTLHTAEKRSNTFEYFRGFFNTPISNSTFRYETKLPPHWNINNSSVQYIENSLPRNYCVHVFTSARIARVCERIALVPERYSPL